MRIEPIGIIHSTFKNRKDTPIQPFRSNKIGRVEVCKKFRDGLKDIVGFSHIILIYKFHKSRGWRLLVKPFLDDQLHGVFSTRSPRRPNQIGISVVRLLRRKGNVLFVKGIDVIDGTPLLDIKPYVPEFSSAFKVRIGWLTNKISKKKVR
ncbi:MAG: tRNA (N6-threonylcarbamoyladenosine(37)-N6)-methyltransferase TrmO [Candidatus Omnitrophica bacterium]|nr:tRNA (N6-threonylcarbamoyladenosine(37)-N6)-methyltransferase TrmO [Candidatus Omnitrophota bacterium]